MQYYVTLSTTEAEFNSLATCVRDVIWIRKKLFKIGKDVSAATVVFQDSLAAVS